MCHADRGQALIHQKVVKLKPDATMRISNRDTEANLMALLSVDPFAESFFAKVNLYVRKG
jgi:hypothetical protein